MERRSWDADEVLERLYLGGFTAARANELKSRGITHVLSVAEECSPRHLNPRPPSIPPPRHACATTSVVVASASSTPSSIDDGHHTRFQCLHVRAEDDVDQNLVHYFPICFHFIDQALESGGAVLVHCLVGVSRSATIVCAYLMKRKQLDFADAIEHLQSKRSIASPNPSFVQQLQFFEQILEYEKIIRRPFLVLSQETLMAFRGTGSASASASASASVEATRITTTTTTTTTIEATGMRMITTTTTSMNLLENSNNSNNSNNNSGEKNEEAEMRKIKQAEEELEALYLRIKKQFPGLAVVELYDEANNPTRLTQHTIHAKTNN
jgi:protein-tyrosine phosphatase